MVKNTLKMVKKILKNEKKITFKVKNAKKIYTYKPIDWTIRNKEIFFFFLIRSKDIIAK